MDDVSSVGAESNVELAAGIVSAYVAANSVPVGDLTAMIATVHATLCNLRVGTAHHSTPQRATQTQIRKSITPDHLVSFEDGKPYKTLRRHLTLRGLTPEAYRTKWGLPLDYPMTAATYSAQRSELARTLGLGQRRRGPA